MEGRMMEEIGVLILIVLPHIVLLISGFHEIEREPFGHFGGRETRGEHGAFQSSLHAPA